MIIIITIMAIIIIIIKAIRKIIAIITCSSQEKLPLLLTNGWWLAVSTQINLKTKIAHFSKKEKVPPE
jgi:hypothetical protein